jgi:hypothetical protein
MIPLLVYVLVCVVVAWAGSHRKLGFWGYLFASLLLSPLVGVILVLGSDKRPKLLAGGPVS